MFVNTIAVPMTLRFTRSKLADTHLNESHPSDLIDGLWQELVPSPISPISPRWVLPWANFLVMRRTHSTLMGELRIDGKLVADQCGHTLDVSQNIYRQSPVTSRLPAVNQLEISLNGVQTEFGVQEDSAIN